MTEERADRLRRVRGATGENTKAKALNVAMNHYLEDLANTERENLPGRSSLRRFFLIHNGQPQSFIVGYP